MKDISQWIVLTIIGFIIMGALLHAAGASTILGTFFTGFTNVGKTVEGR